MVCGDEFDTLPLGPNYIPPRGNVKINENTGEPDLPPMPPELEYLLEPGIHYGRKYQFDDAMQRFLENAEESEFETLASLAERARLGGDYRRLLEWWRDINDVSDYILEKRYPKAIAAQQPEIAKERDEFELGQLGEVNDTLHHMDIYHLFGLMDACDLDFE